MGSIADITVGMQGVLALNQSSSTDLSLVANDHGGYFDSPPRWAHFLWYQRLFFVLRAAHRWLYHEALTSPYTRRKFSSSSMWSRPRNRASYHCGCGIPIEPLFPGLGFLARVEIYLNPVRKHWVDFSYKGDSDVSLSSKKLAGIYRVGNSVCHVFLVTVLEAAALDCIT